MSSDLQLVWPKGDVDRLFAAMESARRYLNYDFGHSLRAAAKALVSSLGASTRVAPKFRDITESHVNPGRKDWKAYDVTGWFGAPRKFMTKTVRSTSLASAKYYHAWIRRRGLAKRTWTANPASPGEQSGFRADQKTSAVARKYVAIDQQYSGVDLYFSLRNRLPYIESAMNGGPNAVSSAMARAASGLEKSVERQLVKRMGLGSLSR